MYILVFNANQCKRFKSIQIHHSLFNIFRHLSPLLAKLAIMHLFNMQTHQTRNKKHIVWKHIESAPKKLLARLASFQKIENNKTESIEKFFLQYSSFVMYIIYILKEKQISSRPHPPAIDKDSARESRRPNSQNTHFKSTTTTTTIIKRAKTRTKNYLLPLCDCVIIRYLTNAKA